MNQLIVQPNQQALPLPCECGTPPTLEKRTFSQDSWVGDQPLARYRCPACGLASEDHWSSEENAAYFWLIFLRERIQALWEQDPVMRERLELAGFRYMALIGALWPGDYDEAQTAADRQAHPTWVRACCWPDRELYGVYVEEEAEQFVHEVTGYDLRLCQEWMRYEWPE